MKQCSITQAHLIDFKYALQEAEKSPSTVEKYLREIRSFAAWLGGTPLTKAACTRWKEYLLGQGFVPSTVNGKRSALDRFLTFFGREDCRVKHLRVQRRLFRDQARELTREEYARLVAAAAKRERLALIMETICATGIRVSEVKYIKNNIHRTWKIVSYDGTTGRHDVYRFVPGGGTDPTPVRMQFVTADGTTVTDDAFVVTDHLDQDLTMQVYGEGIDAGCVFLEYEGAEYSITAGTGLLRVRSTTEKVQYGEVVQNAESVERNKPGVAAPSGTTYYINNSVVQVVNSSGIRLLFDNIVENKDVPDKSNTALLKEKNGRNSQRHKERSPVWGNTPL